MLSTPGGLEMRDQEHIGAPAALALGAAPEAIYNAAPARPRLPDAVG